MTRLTEQKFSLRAAALEWVLCDVDGVLTDGRLAYGSDGPDHLVFHVRDGLAIKLAQRAGLRVGVLSGRASAALQSRVAELGLDALHMGIADKNAELDKFLSEHQIGEEQIAYIGDDLPDLPVMRRCGLSFAPQDAAAEVRIEADHLLSSRGGRGAVREMVEAILRSRGDWAEVTSSFTSPD